ncbi:shikimate kinase [Thioclava marina]|uniref:shikimate kinase n=2 Tax=Thioclava TaxID=285107 RepID=UPI003CCB9764
MCEMGPEDGIDKVRAGAEQDQPVLGHLTRSIVLVGMMGSGKTAVGTALARMLDAPFLDSDHEIERAAQMSVAEIFARDGEPFFRARESEVLERLLSGPPGVISTGGGAFLSEANREMIARLGVSVWLKADLELLWQRVRHKNTRPLLRTADPKRTLTDLLAQRLPHYSKAQVAVEAEPGLSVPDMARKVIAHLREVDGLIEEVKDA